MLKTVKLDVQHLNGWHIARIWELSWEWFDAESNQWLPDEMLVLTQPEALNLLYEQSKLAGQRDFHIRPKTLYFWG